MSSGARPLDGMLRLTRIIRKLQARLQIDEIDGETIPQLVLRWSQIRMPQLDLAVRDHDPDWAVRFEQEKQRIKDALASEGLVDVQHCGSTSIPPLPSKNVIDMAVAVRELPCTAAQAARLAGLGYVDYGASPIDPGFSWFWRVESDGAYVVHVCGHQSRRFVHMVNFREFMRAFPEERQRYEALKRDLAAAPDQTWIEYSLVKEVMTLQIIERANAWVAERRTAQAAGAPTPGRREPEPDTRSRA